MHIRHVCKGMTARACVQYMQGKSMSARQGQECKARARVQGKDRSARQGHDTTQHSTTRHSTDQRLRHAGATCDQEFGDGATVLTYCNVQRPQAILVLRHTFTRAIQTHTRTNKVQRSPESLWAEGLSRGHLAGKRGPASACHHWSEQTVGNKQHTPSHASHCGLTSVWSTTAPPLIRADTMLSWPP